MNAILTLFLKAIEEQVVQENLAHKALAANQRTSRDGSKKHYIENTRQNYCIIIISNKSKNIFCSSHQK